MNAMHIDRYGRDNTLKRYRYTTFLQDGKEVRRWTTVSVYDRDTMKRYYTRKLRKPPEHVRREVYGTAIGIS